MGKGAVLEVGMDGGTADGGGSGGTSSMGGGTDAKLRHR
jgi:hypothetical protein